MKTEKRVTTKVAGALFPLVLLGAPAAASSLRSRSRSAGGKSVFHEDQEKPKKAQSQNENPFAAFGATPSSKTIASAEDSGVWEFLRQEGLLEEGKEQKSVLSHARKEFAASCFDGFNCQTGTWVNLSYCTATVGQPASNYFSCNDSCQPCGGDTTPPEVQSIAPTGGPTTTSTSVDFRVTFNENANSVTSDDFELTPTESATGTIASVSAVSGTIKDVTVNSISGVGTLRVDLKSNTNITDDDGNGNNNNGYVSAYTGGTAHTVNIAPEINLQGNGQTIADGDTNPTTTDHTDFGSGDINSFSQQRTFTIQNTGAATLTLTDQGGGKYVTIDDTTNFTIDSQPSSTIAASGSTTFAITYNPTATATHTATVTIQSDDSDEATYTFSVKGIGTSAPEMAITDADATAIADGDSSPSTAESTDFGSVNYASGSQSYTFTITNSGSADLTLSGTPIVSLGTGTHFSVTSQATSPVASGGGTTTFTVKYDPTDVGTHNDTISIANNDSDENPYNFSITGTGTNTVPTFSNSLSDGSETISIADNASSVYDANATDGDGGANDGVTYSITGITDNGSGDGDGDTDDDSNAPFVINASTGAITVNDGDDLDHEQADGATQFVITIQIDDGKASNNTATATLTVNVTDTNDAPTVATNSALSVAQGTTGTITTTQLNEGDVDDSGTGLTYTITTDVSNGQMWVDANNNGTMDGGEARSTSGTATFTQGDIDNNRVKYTHDNSATASDSFIFSLADGGENGAAALTNQTFNFTIVTAPVLDLDGDDSSGTGSGGYATTFTEGNAAVGIIDSDATLADTDGDNIKSAQIKITSPVTNDVIKLGSRANGDVVNGITITYTSDSQIDLSGTTTAANYLSLLKEATFQNTGDAPGSSRSITFVATDQNDNAGNTATATVAITETNDSPTHTQTANDLNTTKTEDFADFNLTLSGFGDPDSDSLAITVDMNSSSIVTPTIQWTNSLTSAQYSGKELNITFASVANAYGVTSGTITVNDGTLSITKDFNISVTPVNDDAPTANNFTYGTNIGSAAKTFSWLTLSSATDPDGDTLSAALHADGAKGNAVVAGNDVTYTPTAGQTGTDTFDLNVTDGDSNVTITVTVNGLGSTTGGGTTNTGGGGGGSTSGSSPTSSVQITNNEGGTTGTTSVSTPSGTQASYDSDGSLQSLSYTATGNNGETTSLTLQEYYKADTANDNTNNEVMVSLNYTQGESGGNTGTGNGATSPTQLFMPSGSRVTVNSNGDVTGRLTISNIELPDGRVLSVDVTMSLGEDGSSDLDLYGSNTDGNGYSFQREIGSLPGSTLEMRDDGSYKSTNTVSTPYGNVISRVEVSRSGAVTVSLTNTTTGEKVNLQIPERSGTGRVDYVDYGYASRAVEDSNHNAIRLRYSMSEPFTLMEFNTSDTTKTVRLHSLYRAESLEFNTSIEIIPGGSEAGFEEILRFDGLHSFRLINGRADMVMDGIEEEMMAGLTYYLPVIQEAIDDVSLPLGNNNLDGGLYYQNGNWNLQEGWSLVGVPVSDRNLTQEDINASVVWSYDQAEIWNKDQTILTSKEGYWIKMEENTSILITGESYSLTPQDHTAGWHLLGAGARMESPHELDGIEQVWVYANHQWSRNPDVVYRGQGFWVRVEQ